MSELDCNEPFAELAGPSVEGQHHGEVEVSNG
jgi:hypothetical protein